MSHKSRRKVIWAMMLGSFLFLGYAFWFFEQGGVLPWQGPTRAETVLFGGDVFLGRQVEERIEKYGNQWPFLDIAEQWRSADVVVVNFESAMAPVHKKTPYFGFQFSVDEKNISGLKEAGVTHVGLANNHAYDYGAAGYEKARTALSETLGVFGHPLSPNDDSVAYIDVANKKIAIIGLYAVEGFLDTEAVTDVFDTAKTKSDLQVVFIHWGDEYTSIHNKNQESIARSLILEGADMIVGQHPHVVQDIAVYDGVPVFYSLGNLVFDQYFSEAVQQGLMIEWDPRTNNASLIPVSTIGQIMQPRLMNNAEKEIFLNSIAERSDVSLRSAIESGIVAW